MNIRLGTDIVYTPRIRAALERFGDRFLQRVYTLREQADCWQRDATQEHTIPGKKPYLLDASLSREIVHRFAGRWAAKEAIAKALGYGMEQGSPVHRCGNSNARSADSHRFVCMEQRRVASVLCNVPWQLSLSHDGDYSMATALLIGLPNLSRQS
ncbi:MAG: holo-ACP synthase [Coleofasciculaceae cyanobacterium SM2_3_26]|nr:holo-ACP synthase [Coleofasciculaceae cyanobacterium SM2_3_26]